MRQKKGCLTIPESLYYYRVNRDVLNRPGTAYFSTGVILYHVIVATMTDLLSFNFIEEFHCRLFLVFAKDTHIFYH